MRKLLNTLYVTDETGYLSLDGNNIICKNKDEELLRLPFDLLEAIVCFSYAGCSPALMGKCVDLGIPISFISPYGKFQARLNANTRGSAALRIAQIDVFRRDGMKLARAAVDAKLRNTLELISRSQRNYPVLKTDTQVQAAIEALEDARNHIPSAASSDELMGIEGNAASRYFAILRKLFTVDAAFTGRGRRPPPDPINAALSFTYTVCTNEYVAALESVGLDPAIGFYHALHSGRCSLACDMVEDMRCIVDRFVLTLFNRKELQDAHFEEHEDAIWLNKEGRKLLLQRWQERKRRETLHAASGEKIQQGLLPYAQSMLMAKYIRGEAENYPNFRYSG